MGMAKPMPLGPGLDGHVDADDLAGQVDQGAAAVAGIDGRVGLDEIGVGAALVLEGPAHGRDHARGHGVGVAEGVADGDDGFADHDVGRIAHDRLGQWLLAGQAQHGQVEVRVGADQAGVQHPAVQQPGLDGGAAGDDVGVGEHEALGAVDDDARAQALLDLALGLAAGKTRAQELAQEIVLEKGAHGAAAFHGAGGGDVDHGRGHGLDRRHHRGDAHLAVGGRAGLRQGARNRQHNNVSRMGRRMHDLPAGPVRGWGRAGRRGPGPAHSMGMRRCCRSGRALRTENHEQAVLHGRRDLGPRQPLGQGEPARKRPVGTFHDLVHAGRFSARATLALDHQIAAADLHGHRFPGHAGQFQAHAHFRVGLDHVGGRAPGIAGLARGGRLAGQPFGFPAEIGQGHPRDPMQLGHGPLLGAVAVAPATG